MQVFAQPVDGLAELLRAHHLDVAVKLVAATTEQVRQEVLSAVIDAFLLLHPRVHAVQRAKRQRARPGKPRLLLDEDGVRAGACRHRGCRHARTAAADHQHVARHRFRHVCGRLAFRRAAEQAAARQCQHATAHQRGELTARQRPRAFGLPHPSLLLRCEPRSARLLAGSLPRFAFPAVRILGLSTRPIVGAHAHAQKPPIVRKCSG